MGVLIWCIHRWLVTFLYRRYAVFPAAMAAKLRRGRRWILGAGSSEHRAADFLGRYR